jgi:hypothetical protein
MLEPGGGGWGDVWADAIAIFDKDRMSYPWNDTKKSVFIGERLMAEDQAVAVPVNMMFYSIFVVSY